MQQQFLPGIGPMFDGGETCERFLQSQRTNGESMLSAEASPARIFRTPEQDGIAQDSPALGADYGANTLELSKRCSQGLLWLKTWTVPHGSDGCPSCGATCTGEGIPACQFGCEPVSLVPRSPVLEYSLPRPTATANQLSPSMRKHPSCKRLQSLVGTGGQPHPGVWEWLMGFPEGWTDLGVSETP